MYSIDWLTDQIREDFVRLGVQAEVIYGAEKDVREAKTGRRVVVGLGERYTFREPDGPDTPGYALIDTPDGTRPLRSVATRDQSVRIWVRGVPSAQDANTANKSLSAHRDTAALLHSVVAALDRTQHGSIRIDGGTWPLPSNAEFTYGQLTILDVTLAIPVHELPLGLIQAGDSGFSGQVAICDETQCQDETTMEVAPPPA